MVGHLRTLLRADCGLAETRAGEDPDSEGRDGAGRQFDDEGRRARKGVVLPAGDAAGVAWEALGAHTDETGETPLHARITAGLVDDVEVLMEPDRHSRPNAANEVVGNPALAFRQLARP